MWRSRHAAIVFYICAFVRMLSVKEGDCGGVSDVKIDYTKLCIKFGTREVRCLNRSRSIVELPM